MAKSDKLDLVGPEWRKALTGLSAWFAWEPHLRPPAQGSTRALRLWFDRIETAHRQRRLGRSAREELSRFGIPIRTGLLHPKAEEEVVQRIGQCDAYRQWHGHLLVPQRFADDEWSGLGKWMDKTRQLARTQPRHPRVAIVRRYVPDFVWEPLTSPEYQERTQEVKQAVNAQIRETAAAQWMLRYRQLQAYIALNGHPHVHSKNSALGRWCMRQAVLARKGLLDEWKLSLLNKEGALAARPSAIAAGDEKLPEGALLEFPPGPPAFTTVLEMAMHRERHAVPGKVLEETDRVIECL